jgi:hypothetical protein
MCGRGRGRGVREEKDPNHENIMDSGYTRLYVHK